MNAIVDFKYSTDPHLTWWFDHHQSAFLTPEDAEHFRRDTSGSKMYDPSFRSCTMYIATVARERFGFDAPDLDELVAWADIVDGAQYSSAAEAVNLVAPATRLTLVIEGAKGSEIVQTIIRMMRTRKLRTSPRIRRFWPSTSLCMSATSAPSTSSRKQAHATDGVVYFDLVGHDLEGYNKFIPYYLFPESDLHRLGEHFQFPDQGFGGFEPLGQEAGQLQPGLDLRALRRRRTPARGRHQLRNRSRGSRPHGGPGNRR